MSLDLSIKASLNKIYLLQKQLSLTAHNISNAEVEGYSKKRISQTSQVIGNKLYGSQETGVHRTVNKTLIELINQVSANNNNYAKTAEYLEEINNIFGSVGSEQTIGHYIGILHKSINTLNSPGDKYSSLLNTQNEALNFINKMQQSSQSLQKIYKATNKEVESVITTLKLKLNMVARINHSIKNESKTSQYYLDSQDKLEKLLNEISKIMNVKYTKNKDGTLSISTQSGVLLVKHKAQNVSFDSVMKNIWDRRAINSKNNQILVDNTIITNDITSGTLHALFKVKDEILPALHEKSDNLAQAMIKEFNTVHNQGTSLENSSNNIISNKKFIKNLATNQYDQLFRISQGDVAIILLNNDGEEIINTRFSKIIPNKSSTISEFANKMQAWLRENGVPAAEVKINDNDNLQIELNQIGYHLAFLDEKNQENGSPHKNATIAYDNNADGIFDQQIKGFTNFFGINNFFTNSNNNSAWQSKTVPQDYKVISNDFISFSNQTAGLNFLNLSINNGKSLQDIAQSINQHTDNNNTIKAEVIEIKNGHRLKITSLDNSELVISSNNNNALIKELELAKSVNGISNNIDVNKNIKLNANNISLGRVFFHNNKNKYIFTDGDTTIAKEMSAIFDENIQFNDSNTTIETYAVNLVADFASQLALNKQNLNYTDEAIKNLINQHSAIKDVNINEELNQMTIYKQSYQVNSKVLQTSKDLLNILSNLIR